MIAEQPIQAVQAETGNEDCPRKPNTHSFDEGYAVGDVCHCTQWRIVGISSDRNILFCVDATGRQDEFYRA